MAHLSDGMANAVKVVLAGALLTVYVIAYQQAMDSPPEEPQHVVVVMDESMVPPHIVDARLRSGGAPPPLRTQDTILPQPAARKKPLLSHPSLPPSPNRPSKARGSDAASITRRAGLTSFADFVSDEHEGTDVTFERRGCLQIDQGSLVSIVRSTKTLKEDSMTPLRCAGVCNELGAPHFIITGGTMCGCASDLSPFSSVGPSANDEGRCPIPCGGDSSAACGGKAWWSSTFTITSRQREIITMYVAPAMRTSSLFHTGRLDQYHSGQYQYVTKTLNANVQRNEATWRQEVCEDNPGKKIFIQIQGAATFLLERFPANAVFVLTADELGQWGLTTDNGRQHGPHGPGKAFGSNISHPRGHIMLPQDVFPFFRQYYDYRQVEAFGSDVMFIPLGSRAEFPDIIPEQVKVATKRKYLYSYMVALTDEARRKVYELIKADTTIPKSQEWHGSANNDEYVSPEKYGEVMLDTVFSICPKGHSVEQFRIYEALEAGSIPVMELAGGYLRQHLPPEYFDSPMLFVESWADLMPTLAHLAADRPGLDRRQQAMREWYDRYMRWTVRRMEEVLEGRPATGGFCATAVPDGK